MGSDVQHKQESNGSLNKPDVDMNKDDRERQGPVEVSKGPAMQRVSSFCPPQSLQGVLVFFEFCRFVLDVLDVDSTQKQQLSSSN